MDVRSVRFASLLTQLTPSDPPFFRVPFDLLRRAALGRRDAAALVLALLRLARSAAIALVNAV